MDWKPGDRLTHRDNPELGPGLVSEVDQRTVVVAFPDAGRVLRLAARTDALVPLEIRAGSKARLAGTTETVIVDDWTEEGAILLVDGRVVDPERVWPLDPGESLIDRLARGDIDRIDAFSLRLEALHLAAVREADGLGSYLGGRIRLFPHQLYVAEQATRADPVRWLLADEVGLGKTVEACLILNRLLRTQRVQRTLVVAPSTLTVQWLGELWRKYHQVFVLLDDKRLQDVEKEYGEGFNPFDAYSRTVISTEMLIENPYLTDRAVESSIDIVIVDEAHHLRRPPGHPGNPAYRVVEPLCAAAPHALLLTATPLEDDAHGFFRLMQLLRPEEFPGDSFEDRLESRAPLPPCTSATRRKDIGGLPPREAHPVRFTEDEWAPISALERDLRETPVTNALVAKRKARSIRRALASGPSLEAILPPADKAGRKRAKEIAKTDPRLKWICDQARAWRDRGEKTLVFVAHRETLEWIRGELGRNIQLRTGIFHEDLSAAQRDIEVAQFRLDSGPSLLLSTECGGEGRNFEFCKRIILFDLPWNPIVVEQRIGRLDRIGRDRPVEIVYFHPGSGLAGAVVDLYESLGLFAKPLGSFERQLARVEAAIEELACSDVELDGASHFRELVEEAQESYSRVQEAAYHELHRAPYDASMAEAILSRVPAELDEQMEDVIIAACDQLRIHNDIHRDASRHSIELGTRAKVESLPGVPAESSFLGSFQREVAVADETIDFFASGHSLVEGLLTHIDDSHRGRVALIHQKGEKEEFGLLALYKEGPQFEAVAIDLTGKERPELAESLSQRPVTSRRIDVESWVGQPGWAKLIRALGSHLESRGTPVAVAAFRVSP